ncbi:MAG: type II secretion system protein GspN [Deltaproteobacteria bacterium]|nr:type II secretion system protein GspN [Deltaproteobacteria bacterium]
MKRKKWLLITVTGLFGLAFFAWCVYLQFPYDELARNLLAKQKRGSSIEVRIGSAKASLFPINFSLSNVELSAPQSGIVCSLASFPHLSLNVGIPGLIFGSVRTRYRTNAYGGVVQGSVEMNRSRRFQLFTSIEQMDLSLWEPDPACALLKITGILQGDISYACNVDRPNEASGKAEFSLASGGVEGLKRFLLSIDKITVEHMHARAELEKGRLRLQEFRLEAKELSASITGDIVPAPRIGDSRLNLTVEAAIDPVVREQQHIPFDRLNLKLKGTPLRPQVRFIK